MRALAVILMLLCYGGNAAYADTQWHTTSVGGPGGGAFSLACPNGSVMTGLLARQGAWLDALSPICSKWVIGNQTLGEIEARPFVGGSGGGPAFIRCQPRHGVVTGLEAFVANNRDKSIGYISVQCSDFLQPSVRVGRLDGSVPFFGQRLTPPQLNVDCAPGGVAQGIHGNSGAFVDRIGLFCIKFSGPLTLPLAAGTASANCQSGYVWRVARPTDLVCVTPESRDRVAAENATFSTRVQTGGGSAGPATCRPGFVWRQAFDGDTVCVSPEVRAQVLEENQKAAARRQR